MKKNVASQIVSAVVVSATDGSAITSGVSVTVTGDGGTQGAGGGTATHEGGGEWSYAPTQAETNFDHIMFKFSGTGAIPVGVQVYTTFPQTGDSFARIGAPAGASVSADIAVIESQTDDIGVAGAGLTAVPWNAAWDAEVQSEVADALTAYDPPTNAEMEARTLAAASYATAANQTTIAGYIDTEVAAIQTAIAALNDLSAAEVNAEVKDVLETDTHAEPGQGTPAATASLKDKIGYLYKAWRNKSDQSADTYQLYNDDATTVGQKATVSDDGSTATKGEVTTGA